MSSLFRSEFEKIKPYFEMSDTQNSQIDVFITSKVLEKIYSRQCDFFYSYLTKIRYNILDKIYIVENAIDNWIKYLNLQKKQAAKINDHTFEHFFSSWSQYHQLKAENIQNQIQAKSMITMLYKFQAKLFQIGEYINKKNIFLSDFKTEFDFIEKKLSIYSSELSKQFEIYEFNQKQEELIILLKERHEKEQLNLKNLLTSDDITKKSSEKYHAALELRQRTERKELQSQQFQLKLMNFKKGCYEKQQFNFENLLAIDKVTQNEYYKYLHILKRNHEQEMQELHQQFYYDCQVGTSILKTLQEQIKLMQLEKPIESSHTSFSLQSDDLLLESSVINNNTHNNFYSL